MQLVYLVASVLAIPLCAVAVFYIVHDIRNRQESTSDEAISPEYHFSFDQIAEIERDLEHLKRVIVVADHIQRPHASLYGAVEHNFCRGVHYLFIVSGNKEKFERDGYVNVFRAIAHIVAHRNPNCGLRADELIDIMRLPYTWEDFPYIFYETTDDNAVAKTLAFRGNIRGEGLADFYTLVDAASAYTIAKAVLERAPESIKAEVVFEQFEHADASLLPSLTTTNIPRTIQ